MATLFVFNFDDSRRLKTDPTSALMCAPVQSVYASKPRSSDARSLIAWRWADGRIRFDGLKFAIFR